jgi:hypothetical protein
MTLINACHYITTVIQNWDNLYIYIFLEGGIIYHGTSLKVFEDKGLSRIVGPTYEELYNLYSSPIIIISMIK